MRSTCDACLNDASVLFRHAYGDCRWQLCVDCETERISEYKEERGKLDGLLPELETLAAKWASMDRHDIIAALHGLTNEVTLA